MAFKKVQLSPLGKSPKINYCGWRIAHESKIKNVLILYFSDDVFSRSGLKLGDDVCFMHDEEKMLFHIGKSGAMNRDSRRITKASGAKRSCLKVIRTSYKGELAEIFPKQGGKLELQSAKSECLVFKMIPNKEETSAQ